ncbi:MAG: hypothetical protein RLO18_07180, partial [Gimesia chilikensis]
MTQNQNRLTIATYFLLALLTISLHAQAEKPESKSLRADLPYQVKKSDPVNHEVEFSVIVTPPYHCKVLKVWVPVPQTDAAQEIE